MKKPYISWPLAAIFVLLLIFSEWSSVEAVFRQCATDADCSGRGTCTTYGAEKYCDCEKIWGGDTCQQPCGKADIGLVLDASGSVGFDNWQNAMVSFIDDLARRLPVAADGVHFGAVTYSLTCDISYTLNDGTTLNDVLTRTSAIDYNSYKSYTDTPCGLQLAADDLFTDVNGDRQGVNNFGLVITDGVANRFLGSATDNGVLNSTADNFKQKAHVFGFGVNGAIESQIKVYSSDDTSYYVGVPFSQMEKYVQKIKGKVCDQSTPVTCPHDIVYLTPVPRAISDSQYRDINSFVTRTHSYYTLGPDATQVARVDCTHMASVLHEYKNDRQQLKTFYQTATAQRTVAIPLSETCWQAISSPLTGDRPTVNNTAIYISSSETWSLDAEKQAKSSLGLARGQICIVIKTSNKQLKQMSELCQDDHVFVVDSSPELLKQGDYIDKVICDDVTPPCVGVDCSGHGKCVNVLQGKSATAQCVCSPGYTGPNCVQPITCKRDIFSLIAVNKLMTDNHYVTINDFLTNIADIRYYETNDVTSMARVECTAWVSQIHNLTAYTTPTSLEAAYRTMTSPQRNVAWPLAETCWKELTKDATTAFYVAGDRQEADDVIVYITSQVSAHPNLEQQMKANFVTNYQNNQRTPQSVICIGIKASDEHVRQVAELCDQDKVFIVDQASNLDKSMAKYINDVMCGDVQLPCDSVPNQCNGGKCVNLYPSNQHQCICPPHLTGPNCDQSVCAELDLVFVLDRTTDILSAEWQLLKDAIQTEVDRLPIASGARVGLYVYDKDAGAKEFGMDQYASSADINGHVQGVQQNGRAFKRADRGLAGALDDFTASGRQGSRRHLVLVTNKYVWNPPLSVAEADKLRGLGVEVHVVGAKDWITPFLVDIAGGKANNVITVNTYDDIGRALQWTMDGICGVNQKPSCSDGCPACIAQVGSNGVNGKCSCPAGFSGAVCEEQPTCLNSDLVFIIDSSQSNSPDSKYQNVRDFTVEVAKSLPVGGSTGVNMAAVLFGVPIPNGVKALFSWQSDQAAIANGLMNMPLMNWLTFTYVGIDYMINNFQTGRPNNNNYALILLDGYSNFPSKTMQSLANAKSDYEFFVVGYNDVQKQELLDIVDGDVDRVLMAYTHDNLHYMGQAVRLMICGELQFQDNNPCSSSPCGNNGKCIRTMSNSGSWTFTCVCNQGYVGTNCDLPAFDCQEADLVIAVDTSLLTTPSRQAQFDTFVQNYRNNNPGIDVTTVEFTSPTNKDGIARIKSALDSGTARNQGGTKAGRMGLLITAYDSLPNEDRLALDDLYRTGSTNLSVMTTGSLTDISLLLEPRDRQFGVQQIDIDQFSYQHGLAQAMLCRQKYTAPAPKCLDKNICFLIDSSQSMSDENFKKEIQFVKDFISSQSTTSTFATVRFGFQPIKISTQSDDVTSHTSKLDAIRHERGLAIAQRGFDLCFDTNNNGDKILVLMADGLLNNPADTAQQLKNMQQTDNINTISMAIDTSSDDVKDYVTGHFAQRGPIMTTWSSLNNDNTLKEIISQICTTA